MYHAWLGTSLHASTAKPLILETPLVSTLLLKPHCPAYSVLLLKYTWFQLIRIFLNPGLGDTVIPNTVLNFIRTFSLTWSIFDLHCIRSLLIYFISQNSCVYTEPIFLVKGYIVFPVLILLGKICCVRENRSWAKDPAACAYLQLKVQLNTKCTPPKAESVHSVWCLSPIKMQKRVRSATFHTVYVKYNLIDWVSCMSSHRQITE